MGLTSHTLVDSSGRLSYRGRVMNRAARIVSLAAAGQVLASRDALAACQPDDEQDGEGAEGGGAGLAGEGGLAPPGLMPRVGFSREVVSVSLGHQQLKGVREPVEVLQCYFGGAGGGDF